MLAVLLLVAVSALAMSTMQTVATDGQVAGFQNQESMAFYAAEAGIADARAVVRNMGERSQVPSYPADFPDAANPVELSAAARASSGRVCASIARALASRWRIASASGIDQNAFGTVVRIDPLKPCVLKIDLM